MSEKKFKSVTKEEFDAFVRAYPRKLVADVAGMFEPPLVSFNDFTIADKWPDSIVAKYSGEGYRAAGDWQIIEEPQPSP